MRCCCCAVAGLPSGIPFIKVSSSIFLDKPGTDASEFLGKIICTWTLCSGKGGLRKFLLKLAYMSKHEFDIPLTTIIFFVSKFIFFVFKLKMTVLSRSATEKITSDKSISQSIFVEKCLTFSGSHGWLLQILQDALCLCNTELVNLLALPVRRSRNRYRAKPSTSPVTSH